MVDLIPRPDRYQDEAPDLDSVNGLIQARIDGVISRRELIRRAASLAIAAPVVGVMLHATSDMAFGAPSPGRANALRRLAQDGQTVPTDAPTAPEGERQTGGTLTVGTNQEPDTLHPYISQLVSSADVYYSILDGLMTYDSTQQLVPRLAESFEISDDGLTYSFQLREGVKFHNGDDFSGEDGVDSFKQEYGRAPIGTGPFKFVEWRSKEQVVVEKFADYWGEPAHLDRIIYRIVPDDNTLLVQLRTGELQLVGGSAALTAIRVEEALGIPDIVVMEHGSQAWAHIDLKHWDHLRMTKVRQALDFATPSQDIIDKLLKGRALPSVADQAPGSWAHNPNIEPRPYDLEQAKALLTEAGLTAGADGVFEGPVPTDDPNVGDGEVKP